MWWRRYSTRVLTLWQCCTFLREVWCRVSAVSGPFFFFFFMRNIFGVFFQVFPFFSFFSFLFFVYRQCSIALGCISPPPPYLSGRPVVSRAHPVSRITYPIYPVSPPRVHVLKKCLSYVEFSAPRSSPTSIRLERFHKRSYCIYSGYLAVRVCFSAFVVCVTARGTSAAGATCAFCFLVS